MALGELLLWLGLVPLLVYWLSFAPAFLYHANPVSPFGVIGWHRYMLALQTSVVKHHTYQSWWWQWVINWRPIWYLYEPIDGAQRGVLLLGIGLSGLAMKGMIHTDVIAVKAFFTGLLGLTLRPLPADPLLAVHLLLVAALMIVFPFSKLLHAPGLFFSPTRNQTDNSREHRHLCGWAAKLEEKRS